MATLLAAASFALGGASAAAQGTAAVIPPRPHTSLQVMGTMQVPWSVSIQPATNYVAIGQCLPVYIDLFDALAKDIPRNSLGQRVTLADFDWTATGNAAVGKYSGPNAWAVCACPAAAVGSTIHVMATYPAVSLPENRRVPGLAFRSYIELPITPAKGTNSPAGCDNVLVTTTVATSVPGGAQPPTILPPHGQPPAANPGAPGATTPPPTAPGGPYQATPLPLPPVALAPVQTTPAQTTPQSSQPSPPSGTAYPPANTPPPPSGTAYPPPGSQTPPPSSAPASAPPAPVAASNHYRVIATGFRVLHQTKDDFLSRDGHGDEVYGGFMTFHYDRTTSQLLDQDLRRTNVIGERGYDGLDFGSRLIAGAGQITDRLTGLDRAVKNSRVKGGTATQDGGLNQYDVFPAVADPSQTYGVAPTNNTFPFLVWDGSLTNAKDAVVILPSLWEFDGFPDGFNKWHQVEQSNVIQIWSDPGVQAAVAGTQLALITPNGTLETSFGLHMTAGGIFEMAMVGMGPIAALTAGSYDRPIGVGMHGVGGTGGALSGPVLPRRAIVITREIMEATLAKLANYNPASAAPGVFAIYGANPVVLPSPPPGTVAVQLFESPADDLQGMYILYLKVERLP